METLMVLGMLVCVILCKCNMLNAFDVSSAIAIVFFRCFFLIETCHDCCIIVCKAVIVECFVLNPCLHMWLCKL